MKKLLALLFLILISPAFYSQNSVNGNFIIRNELVKYYDECAVTGSMAVFDSKKNLWILSDSSDIFRETLPASTFKIINSIVSLETGAIKDEHEVLEFNYILDTVFYGYRPDTYHDMDMTEAFRLSVVWFYLDLAKRVGKEKFAEYLRECRYGNSDISVDGYDFWNVGNLEISPVGQVNLVRNIFEGVLPFSKRNIEILRRIMLTEETGEYKIYAKTGWTSKDSVNIGWWVGYIQTDDNVYYFANRINRHKSLGISNFINNRKDIAREVFRHLGIINN
ncbi:MAG: penicillin-binding transpeptidase domain-containing protein [Ignavibacteriaceae bacterium]